MRVFVCRWEHTILSDLIDRGHEVALILTDWDREHQNIDPELLSAIDTVYSARNLDSLYELAEIAAAELLRSKPAEIVLAVSEYSQLSSSYMAALLGLSDALGVRRAQWTRDKRSMKSRVSAEGVRCARFLSIDLRQRGSALADQVESLFQWPVILKPATGSGSAGVQEINSRAELEHALQSAFHDGRSTFSMVEELLTGSELHVNGVWSHGEASHFTVSRYIEPRLRQTPGGRSGSILLRERDHPDLYRQARQLHSDVNRALAIGDGVTHMEVFQDAEQGLWFSEIATRVPGGAIPEMLSAGGIDLRTAWMDGEVGERIGNLTLPLRDEHEHEHVGWINVAPSGGPGVIVTEPTDELLSAIPGVLDIIRVRRAGNEIGALHPSLWCLMIVIGAASESELLERAALAASAALDSYIVESFAEYLR